MDSTVIPVRVTLESSSRDDSGALDAPIRIMTTGQLKPTPSGYVLRYIESAADDATGQVTSSPVTLSLQPDRVVMNRAGEFGTTMVFVKDTRFEGLYHTPYGDMGLALYTTHVYCKAAPEKGTVRLEYQIDMRGSYAATQTIALDYVAEAGAC